jgi:hypothetical protein
MGLQQPQGQPRYRVYREERQIELGIWNYRKFQLLFRHNISKNRNKHSTQLTWTWLGELRIDFCDKIVPATLEEMITYGESLYCTDLHPHKALL